MKTTNTLTSTVKTIYSNDPMFALITDLKSLIGGNRDNRTYAPNFYLSEKIIKGLLTEKPDNLSLTACLELMELIEPFLKTSTKLKNSPELDLIYNEIITYKVDDKQGIYIGELYHPTYSSIIQPDPQIRFDNGCNILKKLSNESSKYDLQFIRKVNFLIFKPYAGNTTIGKLALILGE